MSARNALARSGPVLALIIFVVSLVAAITLVPGRSNAAGQSTFWRIFVGDGGTQAERYDSLKEMTSSANAVVLAEVTSILPGRSWTADSRTGELAANALVKLRVIELLSGSVEPGQERELNLEVFLYNEKVYERLIASKPSGRVIAFLRNKGFEATALGMKPEEIEVERPFYRIVSGEGLFEEVGGRTQVPQGAEGEFARNLQGGSFDQLIAAVRSALAT